MTRRPVTHPVRELSVLALEVARVLNTEPDPDRREFLREHFATILDEELECAALSRGLAPVAPITDAVTYARGDVA